MKTNQTPIGISGLAAYVPPYRIWLKDWCEWTDNQWPKIREGGHTVGAGVVTEIKG